MNPESVVSEDGFVHFDLPLPPEMHDALAERAGFIDDRERAADQEHEEDDGSSVSQSLGDGDERLERADMVRFDPVVGACDDDGASGRWVLAAVVLAGGEDVAADRRDENARGQEGERMRKARACHVRAS